MNESDAAISESTALIDHVSGAPSSSLEKSYRMYGRRWLVLAAFSILTFTNATLWITFSSIATNAERFWPHMTPLRINLLSAIYMAMGIPCTLPASLLIDKSLRKAVVVGGLLTAAGGWIRYFGKAQTDAGFYVLFFGQALAAIAQSFLISAPSKLATVWFSSKQRTLATSIASLANTFGIAIGMVLPPVIVKSDSDIPFLLLFEALAASAACVCVFCLFLEKPPSPPAPLPPARSERESFLSNVMILLKCKPYVQLLLSFAFGVSCFNAFCTILTQLATPFGYTQTRSGLFGVTVILVGLVGGALSGILADRFRAYKTILLSCFIGTSCALLLFALELKPENSAVLFVSCGILGFFALGVLPVGMETACELIYPRVGEGFACGFLLLTGQAVGTALVLILGAVSRPLVVMSGVIVFAVVNLIFLPPRYERQRAEKRGEKVALLSSKDEGNGGAIPSWPNAVVSSSVQIQGDDEESQVDEEDAPWSSSAKSKSPEASSSQVFSSTPRHAERL